MLLGKKLKEARKLSGDTQAVASKRSGVSQSDISYMEAGKRANFPSEYLVYLLQHGIDLNSLFDETKETTSIQKDRSGEIRELKEQLEKNEEMIGLLKDAITLRDVKIKQLTDNREEIAVVK